MSLFRRERVYASIELDRVALVRLGADGGMREQALVPLSLDPARPAEALHALARTLASPAWRGPARFVVLSDRLVRYLVMERPQGIRSARELKLACEARIAASFELPLHHWEVAVDARPFTERFLVCASARTLLDAVRATFAADGPLGSVRPYLVSELRRLARHLPAPCWFVAAAHDSVALAALVDDGLRAVRVLAIDQPTIPSVEEALAREALLAGEVPEGAPVLLAGPVSGDPSASLMRRVDAAHWGSENATWSGTYRLALSEQWA